MATFIAMAHRQRQIDNAFQNLIIGLSYRQKFAFQANSNIWF